jgi:hypothetical protein
MKTLEHFDRKDFSGDNEGGDFDKSKHKFKRMQSARDRGLEDSSSMQPRVKKNPNFGGIGAQ